MQTTEVSKIRPRLVTIGLLLSLLGGCAEVVPSESTDTDPDVRVETDAADSAGDSGDPVDDGTDAVSDVVDDGASDPRPDTAVDPIDDSSGPDGADAADDGSATDGPDDADDAAVDASGDSLEDPADASDAPDGETNPDVDASDAGDDEALEPEVVIGCVSDADCTEPDQVCALVELPNGLLATECRDAMGLIGGGSVCFVDSSCETNHCLYGAYCGALCESDSDCPANGDSCAPLTIVVDDGGTPDTIADDTTQNVNFCLRDAWGDLLPCAVAADCPEGDVCTLFDDSRLGLDRRCQPRNLLGTRDGSCDVNSDCETSVCVGGSFCFWPCVENADCSGSNRCHPVVFAGPASQEESEVNSCIPVCTSSQGCDSTEACNWYASIEPTDELVTFCSPAVGTLDSGAACGVDADCKSGDCGTNHRCIGPCDPVGQTGCAGGTICYPSMVYVTFDQGTEPTDDDRYDAISTCLLDIGSYDVCESDADCSVDETCNVTADRWLTTFERHCVTAVGGGLPGESCLVGDDCRSGICLSEGICFGLCDIDGEGSTECADGRTCQSSSFVIDFFGTSDNPHDDVSESLDVCL